MHFSLIDRVIQLEPGVSITAVKCLSMGEEYLADHFPRFPVMPGVLMLQAMTDASTLLIGASEDFAHSIVTLKEARNIRFAGFVQPGRTLTVTATIRKQDEREVELKAEGTLEGSTAVNGRLVLERYNLADTRPGMAATDAYLRERAKARLAMMFAPEKAPNPEA
ncbi:MAG: beta-hydroxyacyl-ACP dehydratase [Planctomycetota bacterium]|nr:MAG: beta-hydroxyacyl-ACP dehydratase [Planctomycetota bacterium]